MVCSVLKWYPLMWRFYTFDLWRHFEWLRNSRIIFQDFVTFDQNDCNIWIWNSVFEIFSARNTFLPRFHLVLSILFNVPPTPSMAPFPCEVAKKFHVIRFRQNSWQRSCIYLNMNLFLNWAAGPSLHRDTSLYPITNSVNKVCKYLHTATFEWSLESDIIAPTFGAYMKTIDIMTTLLMNNKSEGNYVRYPIHCLHIPNFVFGDTIQGCKITNLIILTLIQHIGDI